MNIGCGTGAASKTKLERIRHIAIDGCHIVVSDGILAWVIEVIILVQVDIDI